MGTLELFIVAVGLSMDAFAVAMCKGLSVKKVGVKNAAITGLYFGGFQALMPLIGYLLGSYLEKYIKAFDHWVAFILMGLIGFNMLREAFSKDEECLNCSFNFKTMLPLAVATSIDALAIGVGFASIGVNIVPAVCFIGVITFALSCVGIYIGNIFGAKFKAKAEAAGGIILILMGLKILIEHLFEL